MQWAVGSSCEFGVVTNELPQKQIRCCASRGQRSNNSTRSESSILLEKGQITHEVDVARCTVITKVKLK